MGKYEDTMDGIDMICPYCGYKYQVESEDYSEDCRIEECGECGKKYHAYTNFTVSHHAKPDCELNGTEHDWQPQTITEGTHDFCSICGKCRPL